MKRQGTIKKQSINLTLITLLALFVSVVAYQKNDSGAVSASSPANSNEAKQAISPGNHTDNQDPHQSNQNNSNAGSGKTKKPGIKITLVPPEGAGPDRVERIAGSVSGVNVRDCKVVIFTHTNTWYVQPFIDSSDTPIKEDGTWDSDTHLGSEYAALLVKNSYEPPPTTGKLPEVKGLVLAIDKVAAKR